MKQAPKILKQFTLASSRLFSIEQLDLEFSNGITTSYERLVGSPHGAVLIVPMLDAETVLLISEYSVGTERYEIAFPKGRIEKDEDMLTAANRELSEEIGYAAKKLTHLKSVTLAPGYFSRVTHIILAEDLYEQKSEGDEPEPLEIIPWNINETASLISKEHFTEARSILALFLTQQTLGQQ